jgi:cellulose synthase/poly-beta-1,6-N-acetylglucosamine synthase-like glycosyltransferase
MIDAIGGIAAAASLPGSLTLALLSAAALPPPRRAPETAGEGGRIAIVVPAHDEAASIGLTASALSAACAADGAADLWVIADNCSDATAVLAAAAGARVIVRDDPTRRGKGPALAHAFATLAAAGYAWYIVVDADSELAPGFLAAMRRAMTPDAAALQACYLARPATTPRGRVARLAQIGYNLVRPLGRCRLGCSAGILGNGFALRGSLLAQVPYAADSVVEDLEYHLMLVGAGVDVGFVPEALVLGEIAESARGARQQRTRWEGGRLRMLATRAPALASAVLRGDRRLLEPLADLLLLPLGLHLLLVAISLLAPAPLAAAAVGAGVTALLAYVAAILLRGPVGRQDLAALLAAPGYLAWKIALLPATLAHSRRAAAWNRSERAIECQGS